MKTITSSTFRFDLPNGDQLIVSNIDGAKWIEGLEKIAKAAVATRASWNKSAYRTNGENALLDALREAGL